MAADIRGLIFDLDGVITDTVEYHYRAWKRLADEEGIAFSREDNDALRGLSRRDSLYRVMRGRAIDEATAEALMVRKTAYFHQYLETFTPANRLPGIDQVCAEARAANLRLGLGSASKNARDVLDKLGMSNTFDVVGDGYSIVNPKPAPDIFLWVAGALGVYPWQAVIFEDAEAGIEAALRGGFWTVGLGNAGVDRAHVRLPSLEGVTLADILAQFD